VGCVQTPAPANGWGDAGSWQPMTVVRLARLRDDMVVEVRASAFGAWGVSACLCALACMCVYTCAATAASPSIPCLYTCARPVRQKKV